MPSIAPRPVILLGTGGSGTTVVHAALARHPELAWLNRPCALAFPSRPAAMRLALQAFDLPLLGHAMRPWLRPSECYEFWSQHFAGFSRPVRDLGREDMTERARRRLREAFSQVPTSRRRRLLIKITGWPRLGFLKALFPDALLVHVVRDGRAQVNTMLGKNFWRGWQGPDNWRWGPLTPEHEQLWHSHDRSFVALAAINWNLLLDAFQDTREQVEPADLIDVRYEDFAADSISVLRRIADAAGLSWSSSYERQAESIGVRERSHWLTDLTEEQQEVLSACLSTEHMERYGYWTGNSDSPTGSAKAGE